MWTDVKKKKKKNHSSHSKILEENQVHMLIRAGAPERRIMASTTAVKPTKVMGECVHFHINSQQSGLTTAFNF